MTATLPPDRVRTMRWAHRRTELADRIRRVARRCDRLTCQRDCAASSAADIPLRASEAARRLGIPSHELLELIQQGNTDTVIVDGDARIKSR